MSMPTLTPGGPGATEPTIAEIIALYLQDEELRRRNNRLSDRQVERERFYLESFKAMYGTQPVSQARKSDLTRWLLEHPE